MTSTTISRPSPLSDILNKSHSCSEKVLWCPFLMRGTSRALICEASWVLAVDRCEAYGRLHWKSYP